MKCFPHLTFAMSALLAGVSSAQDITNLGGDLTSSAPIQVALQLSAPNLGSSELTVQHLAGHSVFHTSQEFTVKNDRRVIGPHFNNTFCGGCHINDGRGEISFAKKVPGSGMLIKVSRRGALNRDGSARGVPGAGTQLQDHSVTGKPRFNIKLKWRTVRGKYPDGEPYTLRRPLLTFDIPKIDEKRVLHSLRMTPPLVGMGLLEAIPESTLLALSDPQDLNGDNISGRLNYVPDIQTGGAAPGRFGFKASHPSVKQQSAAAFFHDMGMTSELFPDRRLPAEVTPQELELITFYQQVAGIPPARNQDDSFVIRGKELFKSVGCDSCHVMTLTTGDTALATVANQEIHPFTDLLLHDMGRGLADDRPEFKANGREWRTTPLWGLGLHKFLSEKRPGFLHDGRGRTIEEAILWHGGEGAGAQRRFKGLTKTDRTALLEFLKSL